MDGSHKRSTSSRVDLLSESEVAEWTVQRLTEYCLEHGVPVSPPFHRAQLVAAILSHSQPKRQKQTPALPLPFRPQTTSRSGDNAEEQSEEEGEGEEEEEEEQVDLQVPFVHRGCPLAELVPLAGPLASLEAYEWPRAKAMELLEWDAAHGDCLCRHEDCWGEVIKEKILIYRDEFLHNPPDAPEKPMKGSVSGDDLLPVIRGLVGRRYEEWSEAEIEALAQTIAGTGCLDFSTASPEAVQTYLGMREEYYRLIDARADFREKIDPSYLVVDVSAGVPAALPATLAALPAAFHVVLEQGRHWFIRCGGATAGQQRQKAHYVGGFIQGRHPGVRVWHFNTSSPLEYW